MEYDGKARSESLGRERLCLVEVCKDSQPAEESGQCVQITCSITHDKNVAMQKDKRLQAVIGTEIRVVIMKETDEQ